MGDQYGYDKLNPHNPENSAVTPSEYEDAVQMLIEAAEQFIAKVESGEARSKRSYAAFKAALAEIKRTTTNEDPTNG